MPDHPDQSVIVYLAGNNGSGKSSLGRALASRTDFQHLPEERFETSYLKDLFTQQRRWSFEAQVHFLAFKITQVQNAVASHAKVFVDRSPYEDAEIFARYFYEIGKMDRRSYRTYVQIYRGFIRALPEPDLIIYCRCPMSQLVERVEGRNRDYERLYPKHHLRHLNYLYEAWLGRASRMFPGRIFEVDTTSYDATSSDPVLDRMASDVLYLITNRHSFSQISLFPNERPTDVQQLLFEAQAFHNLVRPLRLGARPEGKKPVRKPTAYIAAPFTGKAAPASSGTSSVQGIPDLETLFLVDKSPAHGVIGDLEYRMFLETIERGVAACGYDTILPHRDVNRWGERLLTPEQACAECTEHVFRSDLLVAFPQSSFGAHYEIGVAIGYGLPVVLLIPETDSTSFIMHGLSSQPNVLEVRFTSSTDLIQRLSLRLNALAASFRV